MMRCCVTIVSVGRRRSAAFIGTFTGQRCIMVAVCFRHIVSQRGDILLDGVVVSGAISVTVQVPWMPRAP